jgi:hypothetical protein
VPGSDVDELLWGNGPAVRNERENTPDDKALFEAASRIVKLGERENLTLEKAVGCVACSKQVALLNTTINSGSAESSVAAPPAIATIADKGGDSDDEE